MKTPILKFSLIISAFFITFISADAQVEFKRLDQNNPDAVAFLGTGLWGTPLPMDWDSDGLRDIVMSCNDTPYHGIYFFKNIGTREEAFFAAAVKICDKAIYNTKYSQVGEKEHVVCDGKEMLNFRDSLLSCPSVIEYSGNRVTAQFKTTRSRMWVCVDWEGDGDEDYLVGIDSTDDYGWDDAYDKNGRWTKGDYHGVVYLLENVDGNLVNKGKVLAGGFPIDVSGAPNPCYADFDSDGDYDIICGEFVDGFTWFENVGTREKPQFAKGRTLVNKNGEIRLHTAMITPVAVDFDGDGNMDLVVGDEDGRVAFLKNSGKIKNGMPQFGDPDYFMQQAGPLKFGALSTPCSYDWDADGDEDIITGNAAGDIAFIENLSGGTNPVWAEPRLMHSAGKNLRIIAGYNGSIQGPNERKWGYTVLSVADWDNDGRPDIIVNSIWGKIVWYRNLGEDNDIELSEAMPVEVAWTGPAPKPQWNWWNPQPRELVTQWRTTPVAIDWNKDGLTDLICLDHEGYLAYFERFVDASGALLLKPGKRIFYGTNCSIYDFFFARGEKDGVYEAKSGPLQLNSRRAGGSGRRKICFADVDNDGKLDLLVDGDNACWLKNLGTDEEGNYLFEYVGNISDVKLANHSTCPTPTDWDKDGRCEILLGAEDGHFYISEGLGKISQVTVTR